MPDRENVIEALDCCLDIVRAGRWASGCIACPYAERKPDCREKMLVDAIALLKEQEPRVLNWDEVGNYSVVFGEFRGVKEIFPLIITKDMFGEILCWNPGINRSREFILLASDEEDRRNTRCWNREPTEEQRQEVKWDG